MNHDNSNWQDTIKSLQLMKETVDAGLVPLVQLLCNEMCHAFEARGMACPPWRQAKAMLSKWLPAKVRRRAAKCPRDVM